jgi:peptide/nickel transport system ATP-binding protein
MVTTHLSHTQRAAEQAFPSSLGPPLIEVANLTVAFPSQDERLTAVVRDVSFAIQPNEVLALVGESGSGKTQTALAMLGLTRPPGRVTGGSIRIEGEEIIGAPESALQCIRGGTVAMIFQSPRTSLNPLKTVGDQLGRVYQRHRGLDKKRAKQQSLAMLGHVGITAPERVDRSYPHQLSGGMAQRVLIGMMLACQPRLLIADEPTTGLDVTIQAQIFALIREIQAETRMAMLLITHDLGIVAENCDRVAVMQQGRLVEIAPALTLFSQARHPYTLRLLGSILRPDQPSRLIDLDAPPANDTTIVHDGQRFRAISVNCWKDAGASRPEMLEVSPGHIVLCHPDLEGLG